MLKTCITFSINNNKYLTPIIHIKEIIDIKYITPFPIKIPHYIGIINLRGLLINILELNPNKIEEIKIDKKSRIIIFSMGSNTSNSYFGVIGHSIQKQVISTIEGNERSSSCSENIDIKGLPYTTFSPDYFIQNILGESNGTK